MRTKLYKALIGLFLAFGLLAGAAAQQEGGGEGADGGEAATPYAALADLIEDPASRERLVNELRGLAAEGGESVTQAETAAPDAPASLPRRIAELTQGIAEGAVGEFRNAAQALASLEGDGPAVDWSVVGSAAVQLGLVIVVTVGAFVILRRLARGLFGRANQWVLTGPPTHALVRRVAAVVFGAVVDLLVIVLAWVVGYGLALLAFGEPGMMDTRQTLFLNAFLLIESAKALLRVIFASRDDGLRLLPLPAEDAAYWNLWLARLVGFIGYGLMLVVPILNATLSPALGRVVALLVMLAALVSALSIILQNRHKVRDKLAALAERSRTGAARVGLSTLSRTWHWIAMAYVVALALVSLLRPAEALPFMARATAVSLLAIGAGFFVSVLLGQVISRKIRIPEETRRKFPQLEGRLNAYVPTVLKVVRLVIVAVVVATLLDAWSIFDAAGWAVSAAGQAFLASMISVALIVLAATVLWLAIVSWIEHRLNPETGGGEPGARERTLLALFRNAVLVVLVTMTVMISLSEFGIDIGPLIAGAGVLGLAIGFGAQKLVQDIITGVFIQLENAINTGDVVTAGGITGTAERLSIRSVGIRDLSGTFHIVPFSSVDTVSNFNREFAYHVGVYGVAYRENTDEVIEHLQAAFDELRQDPVQAPNLLEDLEIHGVTELADSSVNVRVRLKVVAGTQWAVGRAYNRLVKRHFDAAGIEIPFPHMTLYFGEDKQGGAPPANIRLLGEERGGEPTPPRRPADPDAPDPATDSGSPPSPDEADTAPGGTQGQS
ncbi:mechanosensitive ion channel domain-containing protein [Spiribacter halobius]|uniref:mechanosensitive ion channel domain-containing protein n=1 Tax=Sediminicurvatus halobius TaxID=2182432 RepID=UPI001E387DEC|nr:mechanosensitive ion channel domain-containing protein [Spiribacter halobius]UEX76512.1 mechanosensitive ion channel [Spiribacter halobius]